MEIGYESVGIGLKASVYLLVYKGQVMYVGQSAKPLARFYSHLHTKKAIKTVFGNRMGYKIPFDDIWIKNCFTIDLDAEEKRLIQKYRPKYNIEHNDDPKTRIDFKELVRSMVPQINIHCHPTIGHIERRI